MAWEGRLRMGMEGGSPPMAPGRPAWPGPSGAEGPGRFAATVAGATLLYAVAVILFYYEWLADLGAQVSSLAWEASLNGALVVAAVAVCAALPRLACPAPVLIAGVAGYAVAFSLLAGIGAGLVPVGAVYAAGVAGGVGAGALMPLWFDRLGALGGNGCAYGLGIMSLASVPLSVLVGFAPLPVLAALCAGMLAVSLALFARLGGLRAFAPLAEADGVPVPPSGGRAPCLRVRQLLGAPSGQALAVALVYVALLSCMYGVLNGIAMESSGEAGASSGVASQVVSVATTLAFLAYVHFDGRRYAAMLNVAVAVVVTGLVFLPFLGDAFNVLLVVLAHIGWEMALLVSYTLAVEATRPDRRRLVGTAALVFAAPRPFFLAGSAAATLVAAGDALDFARMTALAFSLLYLALLVVWLLASREKRAARRELARRDELIRRYIEARDDLHLMACQDVAREHGLTRRETDVLRLLAQGRDAPVIEQELGLARNTVKSYAKAVYAKLGVHSKQEVIDLVKGRLVNLNIDMV